MTIKNRTTELVAYGLSNAIQKLSPQPIIANRAPTTSDTAPIGTLWVWKASNLGYLLTSITNGLANWQALSVGGGSGVFSSLLVNPGPVTTQGTGAVNISADAVATTINVGTGAGVKAVALGSSNSTSSTAIASGTGGLTINSHAGALDIISGVGAFGISDDAAATTLNIGTGAGVKTVTLGSTNTTSVTSIKSGTGGISLASSTTAGLINVGPDSVTAASPTATVTANSRVIQATFTGFTTANGAFQTFIINSSLILVTSAVMVTAVNLDASGNHAAMQIDGMYQVAGSLHISLLNNGLGGSGGALGTGDNVLITVWVLS